MDVLQPAQRQECLHAAIAQKRHLLQVKRLQAEACLLLFVAAPTMRVPMILADTVNPYLAARAALLLILHGTVPAGALAGEPVAAAVSSVAFPGLGTGFGRVDPDVCARQVRAAIEEVVLARSDFPVTWVEAQERHQLLYTDRGRDLQREQGG